MGAPSTVDILNRLLVLHYRSLPMYLSSARPWIPAQNEKASTTLRHIVEDQQRVVDQLGDLVLQYNGVTTSGAFPMSFTDLHDLSFDFLLPYLIERQKDEIETIRQCVAELNGAPAARAAAEEALGAAQGHLDSLTELQQASAN